MTQANNQNVFLANLPKFLEKARTDEGIKRMSVAIIHRGEPIFVQGFGKRNRNDPFTKEVSEVFLINSRSLSLSIISLPFFLVFIIATNLTVAFCCQ